MFQWTNVEILSVDLYTVVLYQLAHMIGKPLTAFRVTQIQNAVISIAVLYPQKPLRVLGIEFGAGVHSFWFKPQQHVGAAFGHAV